MSAWSYPESVANGWDGTCETGTLQSPIDLSTSMTASIHAPLKYKHYFTKNKKWNRVFIQYYVLLKMIGIYNRRISEIKYYSFFIIFRNMQGFWLTKEHQVSYFIRKWQFWRTGINQNCYVKECIFECHVIFSVLVCQPMVEEPHARRQKMETENTKH